MDVHFRSGDLMDILSDHLRQRAVCGSRKWSQNKSSGNCLLCLHENARKYGRFRTSRRGNEIAQNHDDMKKGGGEDGWGTFRESKTNKKGAKKRLLVLEVPRIQEAVQLKRKS